MRGSWPTSTQSALTSLHPAERTCPYASVSNASDETPRKRSSPEGKSDPMSPRPAAPSTASMSACASTSPSEWPARPRGWSSSTPPSTSGTPASSACASTPMPTRTSATEQAFHAREVGACRHLQQALVARHDLHAPARGLDERGAVRRKQQVVTCGEGGPKHRRDEGLRRLHRDQLLAWECLHDDAAGGALDGVRQRQTRHGAVEALGERREQPVDDLER